MKTDYIITGGQSLRGTIDIKGSPLATVSAMAASILSPQKVTLNNVPHLYDLDVLIEELRQIGIAADWTHDHEMTIFAESVKEGATIRESNLIGWSPSLLAALVARSNTVNMDIATTDLLDERLSATISLLKQFGGQADWHNGKLQLTAQYIQGSEVRITSSVPEQTVVAILLATAAVGESIIEGAIVDPEVEDALTCLASMGAQIQRLDDAHIKVIGQPQLHGTTHTITPDRYEAAMLAVLAIMSGGDVLVRGIKPAVIMSFLAKLQQMGAHYQAGKEGIRFWSEKNQVFTPIEVSVRPYPGLNRDWLPLFIPLMTRADGESQLTTDAVEDLSSALRLAQGLGAEVYVQYQTAKIFGPTKMVAASVVADSFAPALVGLISAVATSGTTEISGIEYIDGRFEDLVARLKSLGLKIERREQ